MRTTRMRANLCLGCGKNCDAATDPASDATPSPGDITICLDCGHLMAFADDLGYRALTDEEMHSIAGDPTVLAIQRARAALHPDPAQSRA